MWAMHRKEMPRILLKKHRTVKKPSIEYLCVVNFEKESREKEIAISLFDSFFGAVKNTAVLPTVCTLHCFAQFHANGEMC